MKRRSNRHHSPEEFPSILAFQLDPLATLGFIESSVQSGRKRYALVSLMEACNKKLLRSQSSLPVSNRQTVGEFIHSSPFQKLVEVSMRKLGEMDSRKSRGDLERFTDTRYHELIRFEALIAYGLLRKWENPGLIVGKLRSATAHIEVYSALVALDRHASLSHHCDLVAPHLHSEDVLVFSTALYYLQHYSEGQAIVHQFERVLRKEPKTALSSLKLEHIAESRVPPKSRSAHPTVPYPTDNDVV